MQQRSVGVCIVLTIITCGIYGIYWFYTLARGFDQVQTYEKVGTTPGIIILLSIITCGVYGIYTFYKWGRATTEICAYYGRQENDRAILYLILSIYGFSIINMALIQNDFNNWMSMQPPQY